MVYIFLLELALDPPVVTLGVVTATTVTLSWSPQPGVGQYEVHYVRAVGSQQHGACPDFVDTPNTVTTIENSLTVAGLQEFSTYAVTVFAVSNAGRVPSEEIVIMTPEAGECSVNIYSSKPLSPIIPSCVLMYILFPQHLPLLEDWR